MLGTIPVAGDLLDGLPFARAALALGVSQVLTSKLLFINPFDSLAYAGGLMVVSLAAIGAAWLPARPSARIDPTTALWFD